MEVFRVAFSQTAVTLSDIPSIIAGLELILIKSNTDLKETLQKMYCNIVLRLQLRQQNINIRLPHPWLW